MPQLVRYSASAETALRTHATAAHADKRHAATPNYTAANSRLAKRVQKPNVFPQQVNATLQCQTRPSWDTKLSHETSCQASTAPCLSHRPNPNSDSTTSQRNAWSAQTRNEFYPPQSQQRNTKQCGQVCPKKG